MVENALPFKSDTLVPYLSPPTEVFILMLSDNSDLYTAAEELSTQRPSSLDLIALPSA